MSSKINRKIAFFTALVLVCTAVAACVAPAFAQTYSMTVTTDKTSYPAGAEVTISGTVTPAQSGILVTIKVTDQQGNSAYSTIATAGTNGAYSSSFIHQLETGQPTGTYTVSVNAGINGNSVATKSMTYTVTAAATPTPAPTPSPTPTPAPTAIPTAAPTNPPTTAPTAVPTAKPTATPTAAPTSTPEATPMPSTPEFPITIIVIAAVAAVSVALVLGFKKTQRSK